MLHCPYYPTLKPVDKLENLCGRVNRGACTECKGPDEISDVPIDEQPEWEKRRSKKLEIAVNEHNQKGDGGKLRDSVVKILAKNQKGLTIKEIILKLKYPKEALGENDIYQIISQLKKDSGGLGLKIVKIKVPGKYSISRYSLKQKQEKKEGFESAQDFEEKPETETRPKPMACVSCKHERRLNSKKLCHDCWLASFHPRKKTAIEYLEEIEMELVGEMQPLMAKLLAVRLAMKTSIDFNCDLTDQELNDWFEGAAMPGDVWEDDEEP